MKEGLTAEQWNARLKQYAAGSFTFGRGQRPGKGSKWAKKLKTIESCPKYKKPNKAVSNKLLVYHPKSLKKSERGGGFFFYFVFFLDKF